MSASTSSFNSSYDNSNNSNNVTNIASLSSQQKQLQQSISLTPSLTSLLHQKLTTSNNNNNNNDHQKQAASSKQILLNDIATGLADAVAVAVSDAVSSVQQQKFNLLQSQSIQPVEQSEQAFSHLRHQLESKDQQQQQHAIRKNLTNINIEVAVASAVNRYLTSTISKNYRGENEIEQVNDNKVISLHV